MTPFAMPPVHCCCVFSRPAGRRARGNNIAFAAIEAFRTYADEGPFPLLFSPIFYPWHGFILDFRCHRLSCDQKASDRQANNHDKSRIILCA